MTDAAGSPTVQKRLDPVLKAMVHYNASDLHLTSGVTPMLRIDGRMATMPNANATTHETLEAALMELAPERNRNQYHELHDTDFGYTIEGVARFRCNVFVDRRGVGAVFRVIPTVVPTCEEVGIPDALRKMCHATKGLVLVTGPTGSGKSTTLAALVNHINDSRDDHIITIEDPIEFVHENKRCLINQREVGRHTKGFGPALRAALREDPDVVLIGELRDLETTMIALETAETGHLVFATLHTNGAQATVDRLISQFPGDRQAQVRLMLSECLLGVVSQRLCRRKDKGRAAAMELLVGSSALSNVVREGKTYQIPTLMQTALAAGNRLMQDSLVHLVRTGQIEPMEGVRQAYSRADMIKELEKLGLIARSA